MQWVLSWRKWWLEKVFFFFFISESLCCHKQNIQSYRSEILSVFFTLSGKFPWFVETYNHWFDVWFEASLQQQPGIDYLTGLSDTASAPPDPLGSFYLWLLTFLERNPIQWVDCKDTQSYTQTKKKQYRLKVSQKDYKETKLLKRDTNWLQWRNGYIVTTLQQRSTKLLKKKTRNDCKETKRLQRQTIQLLRVTK